MKRNIFNAKVSFFPNVIATRPTKEISLFEALTTDKYKEQVQAIRSEPDEAKQKKMKNALPVYTASGVFATASTEGMKEHNGFIIADIDAQDNEETRDFDKLKDYIHNVPHVAYLGRSARGKGFFAVIPIEHAELHTEYFKCIEAQFKKCGLTIDGSCKDVSRKRFFSYDPEPYINTAAKAFNFVLPSPEEKRAKYFKQEPDTEEKKRRVHETLQMLEGAQIDITGHGLQWIAILSALANEFGEEGRSMAHSVSRFADCYTWEETENKYTYLLSHRYPYTVYTFFMYANQGLKEHDFDGIEIDEA